MSLMELMIKVVKVKSRELTILIINTLLIVLFYHLLFENSEAIYPIILSASVISVYFIIEVIRYRGFLVKLQDSKRSPDCRNLYVNSYEEEALAAICEIHQRYLNQIHTLKQELKERDHLFSQWIHNMKTSIAVIELACDKSISECQDSKYIEDIKEENNSLKKNLEESLNLLRLEEFARDYITNYCNLRELVNDAVNTKKRDFIYKGIFPKVNIDNDIFVYTDKKWCGYMVEQIISNAIKYSNKGNKIVISSKTNNNLTELYITDEGVGIANEDLAKVFDPFFTGNNGRVERSATGIGLYMVKMISKKLGHIVEINSELGKGTQVKIIFKNETII